jgi:hypothetical protein
MYEAIIGSAPTCPRFMVNTRIFSGARATAFGRALWNGIVRRPRMTWFSPATSA